MKDLSIIAIIILVLAWIIVEDPSEYGLIRNDPNLIHHITYLFVHGSFLHLACNVWYLADFAFRGKTLTPGMWITSFVIAVTMPSISHLPIVGISGMLYALSGFIFIYSSNKRYFLIIFAVMTLFQLILGSVSVSFHLCCFASALASALLMTPIFTVDDQCHIHDDSRDDS